MPRNGKKNQARNSSICPAEITLNDFANRETEGGRLKKHAANSFARAVEGACSAALDIDQDEILEDWEELLDGWDNNVLSPWVTPVKKKSVKEIKSFGGCFGGRDYPLDVWIILGDYIKPEDVYIFGAICQKSRHVISMYPFWVRLYKRHYNPAISLPYHLQPVQITRPHLIKFNVVRALHYLYAPFVKTRSNTSGDIRTLVRLKCVSIWHTNDSKWTFYLKFRKFGDFKRNKKEKCAAILNWEEEEETSNDIEANPERDCLVLAMTSSQFVALKPTVIGHRLADVSVTMSNQISSCNYKVRLCFTPNSYYQQKKGCKGETHIVDFNPVDNVHVLRWWDPLYPQLQCNIPIDICK